MWVEPVANGVTLLLVLSLLLYAYLLTRNIYMLALIVGMPLFTMHTGQGYADLPLVGFALVSILLFEKYLQNQKPVDLLLSGVMVSACVWTKTEGLFFCLLPWLCMNGYVTWKQPALRREMFYPLLWTLTVSLLWPALAFINGYSLTPHATDLSTFNSQLSTLLSALSTALSALFVSGSFGVAWYAIIVLMIVVIMQKKFSPTLLWGMLSLIGYLFVYLFTDNVQYLLNGQAFDRQMLLPAVLIIASCSKLLRRGPDLQ